MTDFIAVGLALALTVASRMFSAAIFTVTAIYTAQYMGVL